MKAKIARQPYDGDLYKQGVREAVRDSVARQVDSGIDIPNDGEQSKPGFFAYVTDRLGGFEARPGARPTMFEAEARAFPEYYAQYFRHAMLGGAFAPPAAFGCTAPVEYHGQEAVQADIQNFKSALEGRGVAQAFLPAVSPGGVGQNEYYKTQEKFLQAARTQCAVSTRRSWRPAS